MRTGVIAKKMGMTRLFQDDGRHVPVTVLQLEGLQVISRRETERDGYTAVQLGAGVAKAKNVAKPQRGHFGKAEVEPKAIVHEFRVSEENLLDVGAEISADHFVAGQFVDIQVSFSKPVFVTGVPSLQLNTTPSRTATYVSGSGTPVLTFRYAIQTGDRATRLDYASASALNLNAGSILSAAALPATLTLPAPGGFLGKNIVIDAIIRATVAGLGQWPTTPDFNSPVNTFQLQFNTAVTGFTVGSFKLQRLADSADPASGRDVSLSGVSLTGSGTTWTITLPSSTNPSSLPGRYKLTIGGLGSGIQSAGAAMDVASEWFFDRI
jgi:hypothetical protein